MAKIFIKMNDERYEKVDKLTGEVTELKHTIVVDENAWFQLYSDIFCLAISQIHSLIDIKVFATCLKCSVQDVMYGNIVETSERFKRSLDDIVKITQPALSRSLKSLCNAGMLNKISRSTYQINPQIAYCGTRHDRAKLILSIMKEQPQCIQ